MESKTMRNMKRGDIYYYDFGETVGSIQSGRRPVLVIQADGINEKSPTVIVASITTAMKKRYLPSHIVLGARYGLKQPSMVLLEQIRTINKAELSDYVGTVNEEEMWKKINNAIKKTCGLWFEKKELAGDIRCLCSKCLHDYLENPSYAVRRVDPFALVKGTCDKCNNTGWDYIIYDKRNTYYGGMER